MVEDPLRTMDRTRALAEAEAVVDAGNACLLRSTVEPFRPIFHSCNAFFVSLRPTALYSGPFLRLSGPGVIAVWLGGHPHLWVAPDLSLPHPLVPSSYAPDPYLRALENANPWNKSLFPCLG